MRPVAPVRQTRNREFAAREPLSRGTKSRDDRGRNRHAFHLDRIIRIAPGPHPRLAAFDRKRAADRDVMHHLEARAPELADLGGDVRHVVELGGPVKASLGADQRNSDNPEGRCQLVRLHVERRLEQLPRAPIEILEEAAVEHDARRVAMTPFHRELPPVDKIGHALVRFPYWGLTVGGTKPARAGDVKSRSPLGMGPIRPGLSRNFRDYCPSGHVIIQWLQAPETAMVSAVAFKLIVEVRIVSMRVAGSVLSANGRPCAIAALAAV